MKKLVLLSLLLITIAAAINFHVKNNTSDRESNSTIQSTKVSRNTYVEENVIKKVDTVSVAPIKEVSWFNKKLVLLFDKFMELSKGDMNLLNELFNKYCDPLYYCTELNDIFNRYVSYKIHISKNDIDTSRENLASVFARREDIKNRYFSEYEKETLFSDELTWDSQMLQRRKILVDKSLTEEQKQIAIKNHLLNLPEEQQLDLKNTLNLSYIIEQANAGKLDNEHFYELADKFSPEIAQSLIDTYNEELKWKERVTKYQQYKEEVTSKNNGDRELIKLTLDIYTNENFKKEEIELLKVIIKISEDT